MHFKRRNAFQNAENYIFFQKINNLKNVCLPTLPKVLRPVTRNTLFFNLASLEATHSNNDNPKLIFLSKYKLNREFYTSTKEYTIQIL